MSSNLARYRGRPFGCKAKQRGAFMVESAFLLPMIMMLIVSLMGVVTYHSERFLANQMLATILDTARDQASELIVNPNFSHESMLVECGGGRVLVDMSSLNSLFPAMTDAMSLSEQPDIQVSHFEIDGLNQYIVTLQIQPSFALLPAIQARNVLTLDMNCLPAS